VNWRVRLRSAAENDVVEHAQYLQDRSAEAAIHFLDAFDASLALLQRTPEIGGICRFENRLFDGIRVWPIGGFKSYLIFYPILSDEIEVLRVIHGSRDLKPIFGEGES
jgi:toxin ParE1/3/4